MMQDTAESVSTGQGPGGWIGRLGSAVSEIGAGDLVLFLAVTGVVLLVVRLLRRWIGRGVEDVNRRYVLQKRVGYAGALVVLITAVTLFIGRVAQLATVLGLVGAGLAIALQDLGKSVAGWLYLTSHSGFNPGSRVEVGDVEGEIIDIGVLKTTILEVGNRVFGMQSSGRLATLPNSSFLSETVFTVPPYAGYAWLELQYLFTYESDWRAAVELLEEMGRQEHENFRAGAERSFQELERRYAFRYGALSPIVYVRTVDSGVELTLRLLTRIRERRGVRDRITRRMLEAVAGDPELDFAYPTMRIYRQGETGREGEKGTGD